MKYSFWLLLSTFIISINYTFGQPTHSQYFQGYENEVSGTRFGYHSPLPDVNTSLLIRAREDYAPIVWQTEVIPFNYGEKFTHFIWPFGMDVVSDPATFCLDVNGKRFFTFSNSKVSETGPLQIKGADGAELTLNVTMLDKYEDQMGFAILKIPTSALELGKKQTLSVSSDSKENNAWYMTFKSPVVESIDIYQNKVVVKEDGQLFHSISADFVHIGSPQEIQISIDDQTKVITLQPGYNKAEMNLPMVSDSTQKTAWIQIGDAPPRQIEFILAPIREWTIYLVQHTHTDIGYTRPQQEILPEHLRYIDMALEFCDQTDDYPDASKFRWTCETSWSVREYLESRPQEQVDRLVQRIKEGRIEATGMFLNFSEIADEAALAEQTRYLRMLKNRGIDVKTAMQNDVNGIAWCMVDYYHNTDVEYVTMGIHAHRARKPFDKPTSFWWESPAGNRLLAYRSEHYQHGNALSLTTGQQDVFRANLSQYLSGLEDKGYPYDRIALQFSGYITDNSPPAVKVCDIIREWNGKYEWPKLRNALAKDFMMWLDEQHADDLPAKQVAWPDWWTDGVASAANETKMVRQTQSRMTAITTLLSMGKVLGMSWPEYMREEISAVYDDLLFYDEHTHGAAESVSDPLAQNTINQWGMKSAYAWDAVKKAHLLEEKAMAFIEPAFGNNDKASILIFNSLNQQRSGLVALFIQNAVIPAGTEFTITDKEGREVPFNKLEERMEGAYYELWVEDVPPIGFKELLVNTGDKAKSQPAVNETPFENQFYKISLDTENGVIRSLYDKKLNLELIDQNDSLTLGHVIYERLANRHDMERLTNNNRDTVYKPLDLDRYVLQNIKLAGTQNGAIYKSIKLHGDLPGCADERGVDIEIRLYHFEKKITMHYRMFKLAVEKPEAIYVSFPFQLQNGQFSFDVPGAVVRPGKNQLGGSSSDWNTIQSFAAVQNENAQILFASPEIPLVQFGDINTGRYYYRLNPKTNHLFSWVLNNYWVTNFKASQLGELRWSYTLSSTDNPTSQKAVQFGQAEQVPLLSRVILPGKKQNNNTVAKKSLIPIPTENILLVSATPAMEGDAIILQLREISGGHNHLVIDKIIRETGAKSASEVNVLEEKLRDLSGDIHMEHFESKFIRLEF
ncbi:MAG TPA: glycoside hydrolase family 38 C-terminal domain-containing protein [Bacteroidales bacterium]|nr:glycoside hydrolase family 38 C-terminal domain-containing protein [Bacteroidales bacterium]HRX97785.1 glycoside hydrolase family 38 C-terminal domain-containing protein [Bacteroidales bacterium]